MKKQNIAFALLFVILGALIAAAPYSFAKVCELGEKVMKCHWTARVELFLGISVAVLGLAKFAFADGKFQLGINAGIIVNAALIILVPTFIIGVCGMKTMHCNSVTKPTLVILGAVTAIAVIVQSVLVWKKQKR
ncbi:MAG: DUF4418 family protein [Treponema sp.]|nr:DUF4418 family protein [Treponema sp.]